MTLERLETSMVGLNADQFTVENTTFHINKLPAFTQFELFEEIRWHLANKTSVLALLFSSDEPAANPVANSAGDDDAAVAEIDTDDGMDIVEEVMKLEPSFVSFLSSELFKGIMFTKKGQMNEHQFLTPEMEEFAFENVDFIYRYELIARALSVNFTVSLQLLVSRIEIFGAASQTGSPSKQKALRPSSQGR